MDIVERLRSLKSDEYIENLVGKAADEINDLRIKVKILEMDYRNSIKESLILGDAWKSGVVEIEKLKADLAARDAEKTLDHE